MNKEIISEAPWVWIEKDDNVPAHEYINKDWIDENDFSEFSLLIRREGEAEFFCGGAVYLKIEDCYYWNKADGIIARVHEEDLMGTPPKIETPPKLIQTISPYKNCDKCGKKFDRSFLVDGLCKNCREDKSDNTIDKKYPRGLRRPRCRKCGELYDKYEPNPEKICLKCRGDKPVEKSLVKSLDIPAVSALPCPAPSQYKECLVCDGKMFYLIKGGILKCAGCGLEFKLNK